MTRRSKWLIVKLLAVLTLCGSVRGQSPDTGTIPETVLSNQMCNGLFLLPLTWRSKDGPTHELTAVFDTGGSNFFIDPDSLFRLSGRRISAGSRVRLEDVSLANQSFSKFRPRVRELDHLAKALGKEIDVFLPFQTFDGLLLILDYPRQELRVAHGTLPKPDGIELFSSRGPDRRPWISIQVGSERFRVLVDSGATGSISLDADRTLEWAHPPLPLRFSQGMKEAKVARVGRLHTPVQIGSLIFAEPIVGLTDATEWIGFEVLRHFVVSFDQENRRLRLQAESQSPIRFPSERGTGAIFRPTSKGYEVIALLEDSPAKAAGLQKGDLVTHIDGTLVTDIGCEAKSNSTLIQKLRVQRGTQTFQLSLETAVLLP